MQKTYMQKTSEVTREWHQIDATNKVLGRLASDIAKKLIGKDKPTYTPHIESGDYVIVTNAQLVKVTGTKEEAKIYYSHSGFPGGLKAQTLSTVRERHPERNTFPSPGNPFPTTLTAPATRC